MTSGIVLGIGLGFNDHAPEQIATFSAFHQQAADELGGNHFGRAAEEGVREGWEIVGNGLVVSCRIGSGEVRRPACIPVTQAQVLYELF